MCLNTQRIISLCRRGFSLIETAIVLGVVGLVIGGIWIAAAEVNYRQKQQVFNTGLLYMYTQAQNIIPQSFPCGTTELWTSAHRLADAMGILPQDWDKKNTFVDGVYGYGKDLNLFIACDANGKKYLAVQFWDMPYRNCNATNSYITGRLPAEAIQYKPQCWSWTSSFTWNLYL